MCGRLAYRSAILRRLIPALRGFNPDLILISSSYGGALGEYESKCQDMTCIYFDKRRGKDNGRWKESVREEEIKSEVEVVIEREKI